VGCARVWGCGAFGAAQALEQRAARQLVIHTLLNWPEGFPLPVQDPLQIPLYLKFLQGAFAEAKPRKDGEMLKQLTSACGMAGWRVGRRVRGGECGAESVGRGWVYRVSFSCAFRNFAACVCPCASRQLC
jgi:hypothetical protein